MHRRRSNHHLPRSLGPAIGLALAILVAGVVPVEAAAPDFGALLPSRPYVRLFTEANDCGENRAANELTGAALDDRLGKLTRWFVHFNAQGSNTFLLGNDCKGNSSTTLAAKLASRGAWVSNYRNGSFVSQSKAGQMNFGEAADLETKAPLAIGTFWPGNYEPYVPGDGGASGGRLQSSLTSTGTTVRITMPASRPAKAPRTWPYVNSRGTGLEWGAHSQNTHDFVSWIRVDNEIMQIIADPVESGGVITLSVRRGIWGTAATTHASGTRVMSPVYIGSSSAIASDSNLSGSPIRNDRNYPLRYSIKIWQTDAYNWIVGRIKATFGSDFQGYNAIWLDTTSCVQYSNADAWGNPVSGWDDPLGTKLMRDRWGQTQQTKLAGLRTALPGIKLVANNLANANSCTEGLLSSHVDTGVLENWLKAGDGYSLDWQGAMGHSLRVQINDWPALYWIRWDRAFSGDPAQYRRFTYGSLLLTYRPTATRFTYGGPWGLNKAQDLYFWNWGAPATLPTSTSELKVSGLDLYRREFANGIVLVNPSSLSITYRLGGTYYDVLNLDTSGRPKAVTSVTVGAKDAAFLLKPA